MRVNIASLILQGKAAVDEITLDLVAQKGLI